MSECKEGCNHSDHKPGGQDSVTPDPNKKEMPPMMQRVIIRFTNGRQGVFAGPAVMSEGELALKPPQISNIAFTPPFPLQVPKFPEEKKGASKADEKGTK